MKIHINWRENIRTIHFYLPLRQKMFMFHNTWTSEETSDAKHSTHFHLQTVSYIISASLYEAPRLTITKKVEGIVSPPTRFHRTWCNIQYPKSCCRYGRDSLGYVSIQIYEQINSTNASYCTHIGRQGAHQINYQTGSRAHFPSK